jgi:hypothetical protein
VRDPDTNPERNTSDTYPVTDRFNTTFTDTFSHSYTCITYPDSDSDGYGHRHPGSQPDS